MSAKTTIKAPVYADVDIDNGYAISPAEERIYQQQDRLSGILGVALMGLTITGIALLARDMKWFQPVDEKLQNQVEQLTVKSSHLEKENARIKSCVAGE